MDEPYPYESTLLRRHRRTLTLPESDPVIHAMPDALRRKVAATWERRAREELKVAAAFSVICRELLETRAEPEVLSSVSRAVHDEVRHAEVCRALASRYAREEVAWPSAVAIDAAEGHPSPAVRAAFRVVSFCCVNEAMASSFLDLSLRGAESRSARAAVGELLADEVLHARTGWTFVARQPRPLRDAIGEHMLTLVRPVFECWWDQGETVLPEGAPEHGIPSVAATRLSTVAALEDVVLPGFEALDIKVGETRAWLAERRAT